MKPWKSELHFNLKWWRLDLTCDKRLLEYHNAGFDGITVIGFSDHELKEIKKWSLDNKIHKITRVAGIDADLHSQFVKEINNGFGLQQFTYLEREICLFDTPEKILTFRHFLDSMPKRNLETFVHGRPVRFLRDICSGYHYRLLPSRSGDEVVAVSVSDKRLYLNLNLISAEEIA